jgi:hypothetical protein
VLLPLPAAALLLLPSAPLLDCPAAAAAAPPPWKSSAHVKATHCWPSSREHL